MPYKSCIIGTGSSVPERVLSNEDLEEIVDTSDEWITRRTGIKGRRISSVHRNETSTDLGTRAAVKAMEMAGVSPESLDMIAVGTVTPDNQFPSAACMVQKEIKAVNAAAFDISAGCTGFLYALAMADNAIRAGSCRRVLVAGIERLSAVVNWQDRSTCVLLADGAGAVVVEAREEANGILSTHLKSDGNLGELLYSTYSTSPTPDILKDIDTKPFLLRMEGNRLFKRAVSYMAAISRDALEKNHLTAKDISLVVPHQANIRIIDALAHTLGIPIERVFTNVHKYGNTSSASIPIALDEANHAGLLKRGNHVLLVSFGAGLTWGAVLLKWSM
jgi:3-oxoacyl-[acyl-carrier-protein] synthase-3